MAETDLVLPSRETKPRKSGLTILIDNGTPLNLFMDTVHSASDHIDLIKFGWGTSVVTSFLKQKVEFLQKNHIDFFFGGTLFEKFLSQDKLHEYDQYCKMFHCKYVEISNGTIQMSNYEKSNYIKNFSRDYTVLSEVGVKDSITSKDQHSNEWIENILQDFEAGADYVITESRESGTSGLCAEDGSVRHDIFEQILRSGVPIEKIIFEAPNKNLQSFFITHLGPNVNLANIAFSDIISVETLRLGLRFDTFYLNG